MTTAARTRRPAKSAADKDADLAAALDTIATQVAAIKDSSDWMRWLNFASKFHTYSFRNVMLMMAQGAARDMAPITHVAGFRTWLNLNRGVRKGERGLRILAPVIVKRREDEEGYPGTKLVGFKVISVFDVQQTDGEALPERPAYTNPAGLIPEGLMDALVANSAAAGYPVTFGPTGQAGLEGFTTQGAIKVSDSLTSDAHTASTLIHEMAHSHLHMAGDYDYRGHRGVAETEAESVAYLVGQHFGLDMRDASFHYVAGWAPDTDTAVKSGQRIMATAKAIIEAAERAMGTATAEEGVEAA